MSENEKKKKVKIKKSDDKTLEQWYPYDIFDTFDEMWKGFRKDYLRPRPWRPWGLLGRRIQPTDITKREACIDLIDTGTEYQVCAEVPGIPKDNIDITITKESIEISGKKEVERSEEETGYVMRERGYTEIYKRIAFPEETIPAKAEATLNQGILEIKVPKKKPKPEDEKHKVKIK